MRLGEMFVDTTEISTDSGLGSYKRKIFAFLKQTSKYFVMNDARYPEITFVNSRRVKILKKLQIKLSNLEIEQA